MILRILLVCLYIVFSIFCYVFNVNIKKKDKARKLAEIISSIPAYILSAEVLYGSCSGDQKLLYVLDRIKERCSDLDVSYNEDEMKKEVETFLDRSEIKDI